MSESNKNAAIAKIIFQAYCTAYSYNHTEKQFLAFLEDFKGRIYEPFSGEDEDAHFLRQMLVCAIGDYGTSPRSGWFEKEDAKTIKKLIESEIEDAKTTLSWSIFCGGGRGRWTKTCKLTCASHARGWRIVSVSATR